MGITPAQAAGSQNYNLSQDEVNKILNWFKTYALKTSLQPIPKFSNR
ncbi:MAG: hypothetical protein Ct9H90mP20_0510 [Candidatus Neomarinimicrobiota bacterium]|nr:MAG: hypothetical protein Ct9H90mP20_0510 [Candidatus Neomarinimicrobiota bacterium]